MLHFRKRKVLLSPHRRDDGPTSPTPHHIMLSDEKLFRATVLRCYGRLHRLETYKTSLPPVGNGSGEWRGDLKTRLMNTTPFHGPTRYEPPATAQARGGVHPLVSNRHAKLAARWQRGLWSAGMAAAWSTSRGRRDGGLRLRPAHRPWPRSCTSRRIRRGRLCSAHISLDGSACRAHVHPPPALARRKRANDRKTWRPPTTQEAAQGSLLWERRVLFGNGTEAAADTNPGFLDDGICTVSINTSARMEASQLLAN